MSFDTENLYCKFAIQKYKDLYIYTATILPVVLSSLSAMSQALTDLLWPCLIASSKVFQDIIHLVCNSALFLAVVLYGCGN